MALQSSDLVFYASVNMPEGNDDTTGGAINTNVRVTFDDIVNVDTIDVFSTNATLNGTLNVLGVDANNDIIQENFVLDGETVVAGTSLFKSVFRVTYPDLSHTGSIYLHDDSTETVIAILEDYVTGVVRVFFNSVADYFGGDARTFYDKIFIKNNSADGSLINAQITEDAGGIDYLVSFGVENSFNTVQTIANRSTDPTGVASYGNGPTALVENPNLPPNTAQGVWLKLETQPGEKPMNSFYSLRITGRAT